MPFTTTAALFIWLIIALILAGGRLYLPFVYTLIVEVSHLFSAHFFVDLDKKSWLDLFKEDAQRRPMSIRATTLLENQTKWLILRL